MTTLKADFNARTVDDRIRLTTAGAKRSIDATGAAPNQWVWLTDGEIRVGAQILDGAEGLVARVAWETLEDIPDEQELSDVDQLRSAVRELQGLMKRADRDNRRVLKLLPLAEPRLPPGAGDHFRSKAALAFGYPELALLAIDRALEASPATPGWVYQRLEVLKRVDLDRALAEARHLARGEKVSAIVLAACASVYAEKAKTLGPADLRAHERELVELTEAFNSAAEGDAVSPGVAVMVHLTRGFAFLHLGDRERGIEELSRATEADPNSAEAYTARGLETYPNGASVRDLHKAVELGALSCWPAYYLAHHYIQRHAWSEATEYCKIALQLDAPDIVKANLHEWRAIARFQQDDDLAAARQGLRTALELAPQNERLRRNLSLLDQLASPHSPAWDLQRDAEGNPQDEPLAA